MAEVLGALQLTAFLCSAGWKMYKAAKNKRTSADVNLTIDVGDEEMMGDSMLAVGAGLVMRANDLAGSRSRPDQAVAGLSAAFNAQRNEVQSLPVLSVSGRGVVRTFVFPWENGASDKNRTYLHKTIESFRLSKESNLQYKRCMGILKPTVLYGQYFQNSRFMNNEHEAHSCILLFV